MLCLACATLGKESTQLIISASTQSNVGQILRYVCLVCHRDTIYRQADPGITPFILRCRALGEESSCHGGMVRREAYARGDRSAPKPEREFYRRVGADLELVTPEERDLLARGVLDERAMVETLVKLA